MGTAALRPTLAYKHTGYCRRISEAVGKNSFGLKVRSVKRENISFSARRSVQTSDHTFGSGRFSAGALNRQQPSVPE